VAKRAVERAEGGTLPPPYFTVRKAPKALPGKRLNVDRGAGRAPCRARGL